MSLHDSVDSLIGNTPMLSLARLSRANGLSTPVVAKLESFNPLSSVKDRLALALVEDGERRGLLGPGGVIVEPTSGNTGIGLAAIAASRGYRLMIAMPENMSPERRKIMHLLGAKLYLTPAERGMAGAVEKARELAGSIPGTYLPMQFDNPAGPDFHERTTGAEIVSDMRSQIDAFVCGVGTGGTITGVARALKKAGTSVKIVAVEPAGSPVLSGGKPGPHRIQGIGAGFVPGALDRSLIDEVVTVTDDDALMFMQKLGETEGLLAGISSGAALCASIRYAERHPGFRIVTLLPDTGERYLASI